MIPIVTGALGPVSKRTSGDHPNHIIVEIGENANKRPGDLRRLALTQTLAENHQLTLF